MTVLERRAAAVTGAIAEIRAIEHRLGVTREMLDAVKPVLIGLAAQRELFPPEHFPVPQGRLSALYLLAEDADNRFALYGSVGLPGKAQPPHNHTTWAVIAGVRGEEHNVFYDRVDNRAVPGEGRLQRTGELTVRRGSACAFLPDDFHTIEVLPGEASAEAPALHLHMYGLSLEHLPERIGFAGPAGGAFSVFPPPKEVRSPVVGAAELKAMLADGRELALLDVREQGVFGRGHLLLAVPLPLSWLELRLDALVPRRTTRIVLCDDGDGLANRAAARMRRFGYTDVSVLGGGVGAWQAAGYQLFSGVHVPSKAFGEAVEHTLDTPRITAPELKAKIAAGEDLVILDSRPLDEYRVMNIPGAIDCPGAELVLRARDLAPRPQTLVVVNCAGRTRSIIGAQSLINAGLPNRVVALENGTMGWKLAGLALEHGQTRRAPPPSPAGLAAAQAAARRVAESCGVRRIGAAELAQFQAEADRRSVYVLDVRDPDEYAAGHLPFARPAPGGQLVQATDLYVGTRNARLVLVDGGDDVRAPMTASWLRQLGWDEVFVLEGAPEDTGLESGAGRGVVLGLERTQPETIAPAELKRALDAGEAAVVDLGASLAYRKAHIPGAVFAIRARLAESLPRLPKRKLLVLASPDGVLARLAATEAAQAHGMAVRVLDGGTAGWAAAGLPLTDADPVWLDPPEDAWYRPYDRSEGVEAAMRDYLAWEVDLVSQIARDGDARFRVAQLS